MVNSLKKYLPIAYFKSIYDIDYKKIKNEGYDSLFFDLDNTIADYDTHHPTKEMKELFDSFYKLGFKVYILSNNKRGRVYTYKNELKCMAYNSLRKPFNFRIKYYIKRDNIDISKVIWIGDQMVTDCKCATSIGVKTILVDPINRASERWYTDINRFIEFKILKLIEKKLNKEFKELNLKERWNLMK